jgi:DNA-binding MarR family transcriptional regulator
MTASRPPSLHEPATDAELDDKPLQGLIGFRLALADVEARQSFQRQVGGPLALRPVEFTILLLLLGNRDVTPKRLARTLRVSPPNVTVLVDRLVDRGLLQRQPSPTDGRATHLLLTAAGTELARRAQQLSRTMEDGLVRALSPGERVLLGELLHKLVAPG